MAKPGRPIDEEALPPARARAQMAREADLLGLAGMSNALKKDALNREIRAELRIIRADLAALQTSKPSASDQTLLVKQIRLRLARLARLKEKLKAL